MKSYKIILLTFLCLHLSLPTMATSPRENLDLEIKEMAAHFNDEINGHNREADETAVKYSNRMRRFAPLLRMCNDLTYPHREQDLQLILKGFHDLQQHESMQGFLLHNSSMAKLERLYRYFLEGRDLEVECDMHVVDMLSVVLADMRFGLNGNVDHVLPRMFRDFFSALDQFGCPEDDSFESFAGRIMAFNCGIIYKRHNEIMELMLHERNIQNLRKALSDGAVKLINQLEEIIDSLQGKRPDDVVLADVAQWAERYCADNFSGPLTEESVDANKVDRDVLLWALNYLAPRFKNKISNEATEILSSILGTPASASDTLAAVHWIENYFTQNIIPAATASSTLDMKIVLKDTVKWIWTNWAAMIKKRLSNDILDFVRLQLGNPAKAKANSAVTNWIETYYRQNVLLSNDIDMLKISKDINNWSAEYVMIELIAPKITSAINLRGLKDKQVNEDVRNWVRSKTLEWIASPNQLRIQREVDGWIKNYIAGRKNNKKKAPAPKAAAKVAPAAKKAAPKVAPKAAPVAKAAAPKVAPKAAPAAKVAAPKVAPKAAPAAKVAAPKVAPKAAPVAKVAAPKVAPKAAPAAKVAAPKVAPNAAPVAKVAAPKVAAKVAAPKAAAKAAPAAKVAAPKVAPKAAPAAKVAAPKVAAKVAAPKAAAKAAPAAKNPAPKVAPKAAPAKKPGAVAKK